ncbi:MAG TPA: hypothetical protein VFU50_01010 [Terriglobales bacterium]|nr:hypothetical protein [Terriglobales bacterium]
MAVSKSKTTRKLQLVTKGRKKAHRRKYPVSISFVDVDGILDSDFDPANAKQAEHRVVDDVRITLTWEYEAKQADFPCGSTEHFHATFTPEQLFDFAAKAGLLTTTASTINRVPKGTAAVMRLTDRGGAA